MKNLEPFWYEPAHQPNPEQPVKFYLRPLNMPTYWAIQTSFPAGSNVPGWQGVATAWEYSVLDWSGRDEPFSRQAKRTALEAYDQDMSIWLGMVTGELYVRAILGGDDRKNS